MVVKTQFFTGYHPRAPCRRCREVSQASCARGILRTLKAAAGRCGLVIPNLGADPDPPLWTLTGLGTASAAGASREVGCWDITSQRSENSQERGQG